MAPPAADSSLMAGGSRSQSSYSTRAPANNASCRSTTSSSKQSGSTAAWDASASPTASGGPPSTTGPNGKKTNTPEFLLKLYRILQQEDTDIISWDNGRIHVRNPSVLGHDILHKYFRHSKYSSFQRQLNYFGFRKTQGKGKMSACTYTNVQLHGGSLKSLLGCKRKTSSVSGGGSSSKNGTASDEDDKDDLFDDDDSETGPVIRQPLKRQRSTSTCSVADSVATAPESILDNVSVKSDDEASDMSLDEPPPSVASLTTTSTTTAAAPKPTATTSRAPSHHRITIVAPSLTTATTQQQQAPPSAPTPLTCGTGSTPRGYESFFEFGFGGSVMSPRGADDIFRLFDMNDDESNPAAGGNGTWTEPAVQGSLSCLDEPVELDYGNDLVWSDTDSGSEDSPPSEASTKDAFFWAKFQDEANVA